MVKRVFRPYFMVIPLARTMGYSLSVSSSLILIDWLDVSVFKFPRKVQLSLSVKDRNNI